MSESNSNYLRASRLGFLESMFAVTDLWCNTAVPAEHVAFLRELFELVTTGKVARGKRAGAQSELNRRLLSGSKRDADMPEAAGEEESPEKKRRGGKKK